MMNIEVLAPAGNPECLDAALMYGADAVYLAGKSFGMRSAAGNFSIEQLNSAIEKAHAAGKRVYVACNVVSRSYELDELREFLSQAEAAHADALIISDLGVMSLAKKAAPNTDIHISTQTGVANYETARVLCEMGAKRLVLARELSFDEIAEIRAHIPPEIEIETFVHGSMCVSFSGRCLLSNYLTGRDANHGDCAQPCRWGYALMEETREGQYFPIFEDERGTHILNSRDMCMIEHIPKLVKAGVSSFKIEGRAKSSYYVSVVTNAYRCAVDQYLANPSEDFMPEQWVLDEVCKVSHREYSTGFYFGNQPGQVYDNGGYVREYEVAAVVEKCENGFIVASQRNRFVVGDVLEALEPCTKPVTLTVESMTDGDSAQITAAPHPTMTVRIPYDGQLTKGALLRRKK